MQISILYNIVMLVVIKSAKNQVVSQHHGRSLPFWLSSSSGKRGFLKLQFGSRKHEPIVRRVNLVNTHQCQCPSVPYPHYRLIADRYIRIICDDILFQILVSLTLEVVYKLICSLRQPPFVYQIVFNQPRASQQHSIQAICWIQTSKCGLYEV